MRGPPKTAGEALHEANDRAVLRACELAIEAAIQALTDRHHAALSRRDARALAERRAPELATEAIRLASRRPRR